MALMGIQLVVSLLTASIMQRMAPHCSFARWLLCNGSLLRFKHPSEGELCALAGKQMPKTNRRDRRQNGENKPLTVPKDIDLHLEKAPVNAIDALVLRFFLEYQWLVDFAVYALGVFLFTECYYSVVDASKEVNIGAIWCVLTVFFGLKALHTLMSHYFRSEEGGERSVCLAFGFLSLLVAMLVLVVREDYLEFGLESGFSSLFDNLEVFAKQQGYADWSVPVTKLTVKLGLAAVCAYIGSLMAFPGLRLAQTHLDAVQMNSERPLIQILLHMSFLSPVVVLILWVKPIARDFLANAPLGKTSITLVPSHAFDCMRLWIIIALCALRLALTRYHLQAYLNLAQKWVEQMKKEAGRIAAIDIQRKVTRVFCYLTVVTLQYVVPVLLILFSTLALKALGGFSWNGEASSDLPGVTPALLMPTVAAASGLDDDEEPLEDMEEDIQATVARLTEMLTMLRSVLTPLFFRGFFAFLTWWVAACQVISSLFGIYFHQYLMHN
ncbi:transmembrane protein 161A [Dunckerocampus dactyliophorus]|uniref:transmembrane protein 161A n=1 Tax=Dunckerocampus dactyliophorus TaxID=161453 RepID=UPI002405331B|nr:transmembrane protein 161A [Dunckerocampus dactyliophorus]XP_054645774.1 transmembrane protein 161A [Dunckerocampus dactyliophorus]